MLGDAGGAASLHAQGLGGSRGFTRGGIWESEPQHSVPLLCSAPGAVPLGANGSFKPWGGFAEGAAVAAQLRLCSLMD